MIKRQRPKFQNVPPPADEHRMEFFDRQAHCMDKTLDGVDDNGVVHKSRLLFRAAQGRVLELGAGTGRNLEILQSNRQIESVVCMEQSERLCGVMKDKLDKMCPPFPVVVLCGDICDLPFEDEAFDSVMSSFTLCSVGGDVQQELHEMCRVCRKNGRILLLERGLSSSRIYRWIMRSCQLIPNPRVPWEYGYYEDRDPIALLDEAKIPVKSVRHRNFGLLYLISSFRPHTLPLSERDHDSNGDSTALFDLQENIPGIRKVVKGRFGSGRIYYVYKPVVEPQRAA
eukprot:GHVS01072381.1.p1 GENE.GHVS01072381.1~~GHVS01072381.1.p1  ORF type:complete len:284 (-),score=20.83 GHVS01072381.1:464-1315(-)